jgi:hypothetical protein
VIAGHGPNIGHGYVKYVIIDGSGQELTPVVFPAQIARASAAVAGALATAPTVELGGAAWWTGDDAAIGAPLTMLAQDRLTHPVFIPALVAGALERLGRLNGSASGACVTGLPATWSQDLVKAQALGQRLRAAYPYDRVRVIAEPLGLAYAAALDNHGAVAGDRAIVDGRIGVIDLGHLTVDVAELHRLAVVADSYDTWQLGTAGPLRTIRAQLGAATERELSLAETDMATRAGGVRVAGRLQALPAGWDRPLLERAEEVVGRLRERWGSGAGLDLILVGGGGAEVPSLAAAIGAAYPHAVIVDRPQTAIARGYARLARRLGRS